jgi:hypothetical protein
MNGHIEHQRHHSCLIIKQTKDLHPSQEHHKNG